MSSRACWSRQRAPSSSSVASTRAGSCVILCVRSWRWLPSSRRLSVAPAGQGHAVVVRGQAVAAQRIGLVAGGGQERIVPERVVIVEVVGAQRQTVEPLGEQVFERVIAIARVAPVGERLGQRAGQSPAAIQLAQEQRAAVAGEVAAGKIGDDLAGAEVLKKQRLVVTVCSRNGGAGCFHGAQCYQAC